MALQISELDISRLVEVRKSITEQVFSAEREILAEQKCCEHFSWERFPVDRPFIIPDEFQLAGNIRVKYACSGCSYQIALHSSCNLKGQSTCYIHVSEETVQRANTKDTL